MNYVYVLYMDDIPFYAGMTKNPIKRYLAHYYENCCETYSFTRKMLLERNKLMKMKVVYCHPERLNVAKMEIVAIDALRIQGFHPLNIFHGHSVHYTREKNIKQRLPSKILNLQLLSHIVDSQKEILIEYGYDPARYIDLDYAASIRKPIKSRPRKKYKHSKSSQLGIAK